MYIYIYTYIMFVLCSLQIHSNQCWFSVMSNLYYFQYISQLYIYVIMFGRVFQCLTIVSRYYKNSILTG